MAVVWNVYQGGEGDSGLLAVLFDILEHGSVTDASTESVTVTYGELSILFEGDVNLGPGGDPQSGMLNALSIFNGDLLVAEATGYLLDLNAVGDGIDELQDTGDNDALHELFILQPITFIGSDQADWFVDSDFAGHYYGHGGADFFYGAGGRR